MACLIDTHVWLWWLGRVPRLSKALLGELDEMEARPILSAASLWELSILIEKKRVELTPSPEEWLRLALRPAAVQLAQITRDVALELLALPKTFHRDPADRLIVATARALNVPVLSYDERIRRSGLVKLWKTK